MIRLQRKAVAVTGIAITTAIVVAQVLLSLPGLSKVLPDHLEQRMRMVFYQGWYMFAPPPSISPTILVECAQSAPSLEPSSKPTYDVLRCFGAEAARHPFGPATRLSGYVYNLASDYYRASDPTVGDPDEKEALERRMLALASMFCSPVPPPGPRQAVTLAVGRLGSNGLYDDIVRVGTFDALPPAPSTPPGLTYHACEASD